MKKGSKQKKEANIFDKKAFTYVTIGLFVLALFALSFVGNSNPFNTAKVINDGSAITGNVVNLKDVANQFEDGTLNPGLVKYLFFFMLIMIIFYSLNQLFNRTISFFLSVIISFIAIAYVTPGELYAVLSTYTAVGMALLSFLPFLVMFLATILILTPFKRVKRGPGFTGYKMELDERANAKPKLIQFFAVSVLWSLFLFWIIYIVLNWSNRILNSGVFLIGMIIVIIITLIMIFKPSIFARVANKSILAAEGERLRLKREELKLKKAHNEEMEKIRDGI